MSPTTITVHLPPDLKKAVLAAAKTEERTLTKVVVRALKEYLSKETKRG